MTTHIATDMSRDTMFCGQRLDECIADSCILPVTTLSYPTQEALWLYFDRVAAQADCHKCLERYFQDRPL